MLIPVVCVTGNLKDEALALAQHCRNLDGTEIKVIVFPTPTEYQLGTFNYKENLFNVALGEAARAMLGKSFFWLEPDSPPIRPGWLKGFSDEYRKGGRPYMITSDQNLPHDIGSNIGAYGPRAFLELPFWLPEKTSDSWMLQYIPKKVYRTPLIQHSYGIYNEHGIIADWHRFPRDAAMIRENALLFHKDKFRDLYK